MLAFVFGVEFSCFVYDLVPCDLFATGDLLFLVFLDADDVSC